MGTITTLLCVSTLYFASAKEASPSIVSVAKIKTQNKHKAPRINGAKSDFTGAFSAHDLWTDFGSDWAGSSTNADGTHNANEIKGWGSASASAWQQSTPSHTDDAASTLQAQDTASTSGFGYTFQQPAAGSYGTSYGTSYGSTGYGTGYDTSGFGYSQPSTGYGYTSTGFGYTDTGYSQMPATGQMPGGQKPMGAPQMAGGQPMAPQQPQMGAQPAGSTMGATAGATMGATGATMGAAGAAGAAMMPGAKPPMPGAGSQVGKCPLPHRHRKPWALLTDEQKDVFIDGFQQVRKNGKLDVFAQLSGQHDLESYVHYTSLFTFYNAYLVWELETAIRDLGGKFMCFTMPYYDWTLDAGKEDNPSILNSGLGGDGDVDNNLCVADDDTGFTWGTCADYSKWLVQDDGSSGTTDFDEDGNPVPKVPSVDLSNGISYTNYDDADEEDNGIMDVMKPLHGMKGTDIHSMYIDYGNAYEDFVPEDNEGEDASERLERDGTMDQDAGVADDAFLEADSVDEMCFWTQANCKAGEPTGTCCLKRKKSTSTVLPTAAEVGDAIYRAKNVKEFQGYLNEYLNQVQALLGADYYAHMSNGYAVEDPIWWLSMSFVVHLRSLWQDCWNYNNIPKDKLDMHYNSYHPYCGTFDAAPDTCATFNLNLDAPMNFYELQKQDWTLAAHKIVTVRKMWSPEYWNVVYELGPFYTASGLNNWCDNTRDSEWFIETMDYDVDAVNTEVNIFAQQLRAEMYKDNVPESAIYKTVSALSCKYNRKYSANSCFDATEFEELDDVKETCDSEEIDNEGLKEVTIDEMVDMEGVRDNECMQQIRADAWPLSEHSLQVKKQLCKGDWDYKCPVYNELLYGKYAESLDSQIDVSKFGQVAKKSFFAREGWIWLIVINGILVVVVGIGCGIWRCSRSKTARDPTREENGVTVQTDDKDGNDYVINPVADADADGVVTGSTLQDNAHEEYQPLLV